MESFWLFPNFKNIYKQNQKILFKDKLVTTLFKYRMHRNTYSLYNAVTTS